MREVRPVWYIEEAAESCPILQMRQRASELGRPPDAFGVYATNDDGTQTHKCDRPTLAEAEREV
jgi:hypothetical protein